MTLWCPLLVSAVNRAIVDDKSEPPESKSVSISFSILFWYLTSCPMSIVSCKRIQRNTGIINNVVLGSNIALTTCELRLQIKAGWGRQQAFEEGSGRTIITLYHFTKWTQFKNCCQRVHLHHSFFVQRASNVLL